jgi:hypothetical protein
MDPLKSFPFGVILRNFLSGFFFLVGIVLIVGIPPELKPLKEISAGLASILAIASLAVGTAVYAVQRAIWIPMLERFYFNNSTTPSFDDLPIVSKEAATRMVDRWQWSEDADTPASIGAKFSSGMTAWADYIFYLFSSAFCLGLGAILGWALQKDVLWIFGLAAFIVLIVAGMTADYHRHLVEDECAKQMKKFREESGKKKLLIRRDRKTARESRP